MFTTTTWAIIGGIAVGYHLTRLLLWVDEPHRR